MSPQRRVARIIYCRTRPKTIAASDKIAGSVVSIVVPGVPEILPKSDAVSLQGNRRI